MDTPSRREYLSAYQRDSLRKRVKRVEVHLAPAEHRQLSAQAKSRGKSLGSYIKETALAYTTGDYLAPDPEQIHRIELALKRIGNNLNQIARKGNREGLTQLDIAAVADYLGQIESVVMDTLLSPPKRAEES